MGIYSTRTSVQLETQVTADIYNIVDLGCAVSSWGIFSQWDI